jgi:hypothetical protein
MAKCCVFFEVQTEFLNIVELRLQRVNENKYYRIQISSSTDPIATESYIHPYTQFLEDIFPHKPTKLSNSRPVSHLLPYADYRTELSRSTPVFFFACFTLPAHDTNHSPPIFFICLLSKY